MTTTADIALLHLDEAANLLRLHKRRPEAEPGGALVLAARQSARRACQVLDVLAREYAAAAAQDGPDGSDGPDGGPDG